LRCGDGGLRDFFSAAKLLMSMTFAAKMFNAAKLLPFFRIPRKRAFADGMTFAARIPEAADESDGAAEEVSRRFGGRGLHQLEFEGEGVGFAPAFGGSAVLAGHHVARAAEDVGVIGRRGLVTRFCGLGGRLRRGRFGRRGWHMGQRDDLRFEIGFPIAIAEDADVFAADSGDGLQQELGDIAEGDGLLLGDAALRHQEKNLGKGAVDAGGGGEVAAEPFEPYEGSDRRIRKTVGVGIALFFGSVLNAELCLLIAALSSVGKREPATVFFNAAKLILLVDVRGGRSAGAGVR